MPPQPTVPGPNPVPDGRYGRVSGGLVSFMRDLATGARRPGAA